MVLDIKCEDEVINTAVAKVENIDSRYKIISSGYASMQLKVLISSGPSLVACGPCVLQTFLNGGLPYFRQN